MLLLDRFCSWRICSRLCSQGFLLILLLILVWRVSLKYLCNNELIILFLNQFMLRFTAINIFSVKFLAEIDKFWFHFGLNSTINAGILDPQSIIYAKLTDFVVSLIFGKFEIGMPVVLIISWKLIFIRDFISCVVAIILSKHWSLFHFIKSNIRLLSFSISLNLIRLVRTMILFIPQNLSFLILLLLVHANKEVILSLFEILWREVLPVVVVRINFFLLVLQKQIQHICFLKLSFWDEICVRLV